VEEIAEKHVKFNMELYSRYLLGLQNKRFGFFYVWKKLFHPKGRSTIEGVNEQNDELHLKRVV
jgi:hypothetical protein